MTRQYNPGGFTAKKRHADKHRRGNKTFAALLCVVATAAFVVLPTAHRLEVGYHHRDGSGILSCTPSGCCSHSPAENTARAPEQRTHNPERKHDPETCPICTAFAATLSSDVPTPVVIKALVPTGPAPVSCYELILPSAPLLVSTAPRAPPGSAEATTMLNPSDSSV